MLLSRYLGALFSRRAFSSDAAWLWVLLTIGVALSARGLFGDSHSVTTMVSVAAMPIWLLVGVSGLVTILCRFKTDDADEGRALWSQVVLIVVVTFAGLRLVYGAGRRGAHELRGAGYAGRDGATCRSRQRSDLC